MPREGTNTKSQIYQAIITASGIIFWLGAALGLFTHYSLSDELLMLVFAPLTVLVGMFPQHFRMPLGSSFTRERLTFTLADSIVLLVACSYGLIPAVFIAGIEGFTSSRRTTKRLASNIFSSAMMSLGAAAAATVIHATLIYVFKEGSQRGDYSFLSVAVAMLAAGLVQFTINAILLSTLLALRHGNPLLQHWRDFFWAMPMFLPTSSGASLMYLALQYDLIMVAVIGGPMLAAAYLAQRQYRDGVQKRIAVMEKAHRETIEALAVAINAKDEVTHEHVLRVQIYAAGVARILGCSEAEVEALRAGALLHDIGKIAVPDYILNKPGKLTAAEFEKMKIHTIAGAQILSRVEFPYPIVPVVRHHHERWDGNGYPDGLSGEEIPLTARILSVVDCFDAVREDRQYRKGLLREEALDLIIRGSSTQYDPRVVGTFIAHLSEFEAEIQAMQGRQMPSFGIEPTERLTEAARNVPPAAGLAEEEEANTQKLPDQERNDVAALSDLAQAVIGARGSYGIISAFAEKLRGVVPYDLCAITLTQPESGQNTVVHASGPQAELIQGRTIGLGEGVTGWVLANCQPFSNTDPKLDFPASAHHKLAGYRTLAVFPIIKKHELFGAVALYSISLAEYSARHQQMIKESAALLAMALSSAARYEPSANNRFSGDGRITAPLFSGDSLGLADVVLEYELTH
jgi:putative nucleotidyltransferase with HDIG domain